MKRIFIAGASGMVGSSLVRALKKRGTEDLLIPSRKELDLLDQKAVRAFYREKKPDTVLVAAAKVGGILANQSYPAEFLYQNSMIANNVIHEAHLADVNRLLFLGSTCIYPRLSPQPIREEMLLSGALEETNEAYALAKILGVKMCTFYRKQYGRDYISAMPTNLYGPYDNYHPENSHVVPSLIRRFHEASLKKQPTVEIWGSGQPKREFLYVEDLAEACLFLLDHYHESLPINVGSDEEYTIFQTASFIAETIGYKGIIATDPSKPDGTPRKKTDLTRISQLGWKAKIPFQTGLQLTYLDFLNRCIS